MANPKRDELASSLLYHPIYIPDPGPPWWFESVSKEIQNEVIVSQLQAQKEILAAHTKAIDRQLAIFVKAHT
jgi:hypothetical protein